MSPAAAVAAALLGGAFLLPPTGLADEARLVLSNDGSRWQPTLPSPVLPTDMKLVPGGEIAGSFWARNDSTESATLVLTSLGVRSEITGVVPAAEDFQVRFATDSRSATDLQECQLAWVAALEPGESVEVPVAVLLPAASGNVSQNRSVSVPLRVSLGSSDLEPVADCGAEPEPNPPEEPSPPQKPSPPEEPSDPEKPSPPQDPSPPEDPSDPEKPSSPHPADPAEPGRPGVIDTDGALTPTGAFVDGLPLLLLSGLMAWWIAARRGREQDG